MDRRAGDGDLMKSLQVIRDPWRAEVVVLPQIHDLADDLVGCRAGDASRRRRAVAQPRITVLDETLAPFVERLAGNSEPPARARDVADRRRMLHDLRPPGRD